MRTIWRLILCLFLSLSLFLVDVSSLRKFGKNFINEDNGSQAAAFPLSPEYGELPLTNFTLGCALNYNNQTDRPHKVLLFVGQSYYHHLLNWLVYYRTACRNSTAALNRVEIFCLDDNMAALLEKSQLHCTSSFHGQSLWQSSQAANQSSSSSSSSSSWVWLKRLEIITSFLRQGHDLILSDLDALWMSSPYRDINRYATESHVIASRGWFPRTLSKLWGTTFCMGFFFVKASSFSIELFDAVLSDMRQQQVEFEAYQLWRRSPETPYHHPVTGEVLAFNHSLWEEEAPEGPDDQVAINYVLHRWQVQWSKSMRSSYRHLDHHGWVTSPKEGKRNRVTFLSEGRFVRNCLNNNIKRLGSHRLPVRATARALNKRLPSAVLAHCILPPGQSRIKEIYLAYYSLWKLPYNDTEVRLFVRNDHKSKFKSSLISFMEGNTAFSRNKTNSVWAMNVEDWRKIVMSRRPRVNIIVPGRNRTKDVD